MSKQQAEPVITVSANGQVVVGAGYSIGDILAALDAARNAVLGVVLRPPEDQPTTEQEAA